VNSGGSVLASTITAVEAAGNALLVGPGGLVVYSRERQLRPAEGLPGTPGYLPELPYRAGAAFGVLSVSCWSKFAVLRSRRD